MTLITIQPLVVPGEYHGSYTAPLVARLEAKEDFSESGGEYIPKGRGYQGFGQEFTCAIDISGIITVASGDAYATTDSSKPNTKYKQLAIYDATGKLLKALYKEHGIKIPYNVTPTNWEALRAYTEGPTTIIESDLDQLIDIVNAATATKVAKAGDTMSGALAMGANKITGLATPTDATDAATKAYADSVGGGGGGGGGTPSDITLDRTRVPGTSDLASLATGLINDWDFALGTELTDKKGTSNLTNVLATTFIDDGGRAALFSVNGQKLTCADNAEISVGNTPFTVHFRCKFNGSPTFSSFIGKIQGANEWYMGHDTSVGQFFFVIGPNGIGQTLLYHPTAVVGDRWYDIILEWDDVAQKQRIIVDGVVAETARTVGASDTVADLVFNYNTDLRGEIGRTRLWKRTLTSDEKDSLSGGAAFHFSATDLLNNVHSTVHTGYFQQNEFARGVFATIATSVVVDCYANWTTAMQPVVKVTDFATGVVTYVDVPLAATGHQSVTVALPAGAKTVEIVGGPQGISGGVVLGTYLISAAFNADAYYIESTPSETITFYGDSILGYGSTYPAKNCVLTLLRDLRPTASITAEAYASRSLAAEDLTTLIASIVASEPDKVYIQIGANDIAPDPATFLAKYALLLDGLHEQLPFTPIYCQSLGNTSAYPNTETDPFRTGVAALVAARSDYAVFVDGTLGYTIGNTVDGLHPNDAGHITYAAMIDGVL